MKSMRKRNSNSRNKDYKPRLPTVYEASNETTFMEKSILKSPKNKNSKIGSKKSFFQKITSIFYF